jgi:hypothetical protein
MHEGSLKAKVDRDELSTEVASHNVSLKLSEQSIYDLALQKQALQRAIENAEELLWPGESDKLTGILHLIDGIQDNLVDKLGVKEEIVFPLSEEEGEFEVKEPKGD